MSLATQTPLQFLSSAKTLSAGTMPVQTPWLSLTTKLSHLSLTCPKPIPFKTTVTCMGCPRISPGGVTKRKWRTMQAKKAKQLHEAGLARERQLYKTRKRAELKAAVIELERPWESVEKLPNLLSVSADDSLEDWFQKAGDPDLLPDKNGRALIRPDSGLHYSSLEGDSRPDQINASVGKSGLQRNGRYKNSRSSASALVEGGRGRGRVRRFQLDGLARKGEIESFMGKVRKQRSRRTYLSD